MKTPTNALQKLTILTMTVLLGLFGVSAAVAGTVDGCAAGNPLTPGNTVPPVLCMGSPGTLLQDMTVAFTYTTNTGITSGTIESAVYQLNGTLDFYYQVMNSASSADALERLTASDFSGFMTDAGFRTDGSSLTGTAFIDGTNFPETADNNNPDGSSIGFNFPVSPGADQIFPGESSSVLVVSTDATAFTAGFVSVIDSGTDTVAGFQPTTSSTSTPEPASLGLLGIGLIALGGLRRRYIR